jgi:hypothetical protein
MTVERMRGPVSRTLSAWALLATLASAFFASPAHAWGDTGHEVVAIIADHFLTAQTRAKVQALLATDTGSLTPHDFPAEATWADKFRDSDRNTTKVHYNQTRNWHFIDIEIANKKKPDLTAACFGRPALPPGTQASDGPADDCVLDKIDEFKAELASSSTSPTERLQALQFLLHFVGDLHQPLHASDDKDQGGNKKQVTWTDANGAQQTGALHHFWDALPETLGQGRDAIAASLIEKITSVEAKSWAKATPDAWAKESFTAAVSTAYGLLPKPGSDGKYALAKKYVARAEKIAAQRLQRAGVRLAAILNEALK